MNVKNYARARLNWLRLAAVFCLLTGFAPEVAAQPSGGGTVVNHSGFIRGVDVTHDPGTGGFFVVGGQGQVIGQCVNADGNAIGPMITINNTGFGAFPRARYSPHINGFLVVWSEEVGNPSELRARTVTCGGGMGPEQTISGGLNAWMESGAAIGYSPSSQRFLVAWKSLSPALLRVVLVDNNGAPASGVVTVSTGFGRDPGVAWNPNTNEFGVSYSGESGSTNFSGFAVVPADNPGAFRRTTFNSFGGGMNAITDLDFVESTGRYLMTWVEFSSGIYAKTATFDGGGNGPVSHDVVSTRLGAADAIAIASNRVTGTSLLTGVDRGNDAILGMEIGGTGTPVSGVNTINAAFLPARYPRVAAHGGAGRWMNTYSGGPLGQFGGITSFAAFSGGGGGTPPPPPPPPPPPTGGGTPPPPPPPPPPSTDPCTCPTVQPGAGWVCSNGGWLPPGSSTACGAGGGGTTPPPNTPAPPPPAGSACTSIQPGPDWVCDGNGNWWPPGTITPLPTAPPPPPPAPPPPTGSACMTIQPGPDWVCVNGNWLPPGSGGGGGTPAPAPPPPPGSACTSIQPGPDWVCDGNGNWWPPGTIAPLPTAPPPPPPPPTGVACTTIQPGSDWVCVNGNWLPPGSPSIPVPLPAPPPPAGSACLTVKPGPDWVCDGNGNWWPPR